MSETSTSDPQTPPTGAVVIKFRPPQVGNQLPMTMDQPEPMTMDQPEQNSRIIKAAVTYCCGKATAAGGFIADHTGDALFGGYGGIVAGPYLDRADRSLRKLTKLMDQADDVMTGELWSLASVAGLIVKEAQEPGGEVIDEELDYLKSFTRLVERSCHVRYEREWKAARSSRDPSDE